jgi:cytochrome d ubiquinol oxidase subunit I
MGLALLIVVLKGLGLRTGDARWDDAARFWIRIFGINFAVGVVTGIPMEFQFGTNWARFSKYAGSVIGQTLAMEGVFAFFLESSVLSLLVFGERRLGRRGHFVAAIALLIGTWASGYFITTTNAFMQHPVGHAVGPNGRLELVDSAAFLLNPWAFAQYAHTMAATVVTASFVMAAVGAFYALRGEHLDAAARFLKVSVLAGLVASVLVAFPTGDQQAKLVARHQPVALGRDGGPLRERPRRRHPRHRPAGRGEPAVSTTRSFCPACSAFLAFGTFHADVPGPRGVSRERLARQHRAALLRVPRHGRARDADDPAHPGRGVVRGARDDRAGRGPSCGRSHWRFPCPTSRPPRAG